MSVPTGYAPFYALCFVLAVLVWGLVTDSGNKPFFRFLAPIARSLRRNAKS